VTGSVWAGLDIGGSKVLAVAADDAGRMLADVRVRSASGPDGVVSTAERALRRLAEKLGGGTSFAAVGVGVPGVVDPANGLVSHAVNLGLDGDELALRDRLQRAGTGPVVVENDVNMAALGAAHALGSAPDLAYLSIGTGLAAGVVLGGRLRRGRRGAAGEIGHVPVDPRGPWCTCGQRGCLEAVASGGAIARLWRARGGASAAESLYAAAGRGDPTATAVRNRFADHLAAAVRLLVLTVDVEVVVLGGGVADVGEPQRFSVVAARERQQARATFQPALGLPERVVVLPAAYPAGALGAALAGRQETQPGEGR
jgi:predicted NBD/HSP70 family sugar kinase